MVEFPHWPFVEGIKLPEGSGGSTDEVELVAITEEDEDDEEVVVMTGIEDEEGVGVGVGVEVGAAEDVAAPHLPYCGWHPTIARQNSSSVPQYPYSEQHWLFVQLAPPLSAPHLPDCLRSRK